MGFDGGRLSRGPVEHRLTAQELVPLERTGLRIHLSRKPMSARNLFIFLLLCLGTAGAAGAALGEPLGVLLLGFLATLPVLLGFGLIRLSQRRNPSRVEFDQAAGTCVIEDGAGSRRELPLGELVALQTVAWDKPRANSIHRWYYVQLVGVFQRGESDPSRVSLMVTCSLGDPESPLTAQARELSQALRVPLLG